MGGGWYGDNCTLTAIKNMEKNKIKSIAQPKCLIAVCQFEFQSWQMTRLLSSIISARRFHKRTWMWLWDLEQKNMT